MGTNFHTALIADTSRWKAAHVNAPFSSLDQGITYQKNVIVHCDGDISWISGTGTLAWSDTLRIHFNRADGQAIQNIVATGNVVLTDGQFAYVDLNETNDSVLTVSAATITTGAASNFIGVNRLILGYRNTASDEFFPVYLRSAGIGGIHVPATAGTGIDVTDQEVSLEERNADITLFPEYPGAVMTADGSDNDPGTLGMTSDTEVVSNVRYNYYEWNSDAGTLQDYDLIVKIPMPYNFTGFQVGTSVALTVDIKTEENTTTNNKIDITLQKDGSATTSSLTAQKSSVAATWEAIGFDETDTVLASLAAGDVLNVAMRLYSNAKYTRVGKINLKIKMQ